MITKTVIMTYYINCDGLTGEEPIECIKSLRTEAGIKEDDFSQGTRVIQQWIPVSNQPTSFQIDIVN